MDEPNNENLNEENLEESELSHTDKLVGIFSEPKTTFEKIAKYPIKSVDWVIPAIIMIIVAIIANIVMMSNPRIEYSVMEKQMEKIEKSFDEAVEAGSMSREQANQQLEQIQNNMEENQKAGRYMQVIGIVIYTFGALFIVSLVYWICCKFILKGEGEYNSALVAYGLPFYITIIQVIVMTILALATDRFYAGTSLAAILESDTSTFMGFVLSKLDVFSIWFYGIVGIGLAKLFKSNDIGKYVGLTYVLWVGTGLLFFGLGKAFPILKMFGL